MVDANSQYYYVVGGEQKGPVPVDQMRALAASGTIDANTLVWTQAMSEWQPLGRTELAGTIGRPAPAGPPSFAAPAAAPGQWAGATPGSPAAPAGYAPAGYGAPAAYGAPGYAPGGYMGDPNYGGPSPGFGDAIKICFSKYATFRGRARRSEFWWFYLFYLIAIGIGGAIDGAIVSNGSSVAVVTMIVVVAMILPQLSVTVRRLHDTDRSGWFYWMVLIPLVGPILLIVWLCTHGTPGPNRFG